ISPLARRCTGQTKSLSDTIFCIDYDGNRPIVEQIHLHIGTEFARLYWFSHLPRKRLGKLVINRNGDIRFRGAEIRRAVSLFGTRVQRKLTDHDYITPYIADTQVHDASVVVENPKVDNLRGKPLNVLCAVGILNSNQYEEAISDGSLYVSINRY